MNQNLSVKKKYWRYLPLRFFLEKKIKSVTNRTLNHFDGCIGENEEILDIGAGCGWIGQCLRKKKNAQVTLLDVIDFNQTDLKLILYDGKKMPFLDNSFDVVLLICVLHHCDEPLEVLKEAKRVTKDRIIIIEDTFTFWFEKPFLYFLDTLINLVVGLFLTTPFSENMAFNFKKISEWKKIFSSLNLKLIYKKEWFQSRRLACFVLKK
ncbi:MAG: class I SAM-dependent methyltransferase [Candidatus Paceibacterales bacterium]